MLVTVDSATTLTAPSAVISRAMVALTVSSTILMPTEAPTPTLPPATSAPTVVIIVLLWVACTATEPEASSPGPVPIRPVVSLSTIAIATEGAMATFELAAPASVIVERL